MRKREEKFIKTRNKSTKVQIVFMVVWIFIFLLLLLEVAKLAGYTLGKYDKEKMLLYNSVDSLVQKVYTRKPSLQTEETKATFATLGNIYLTPNIIKGAKEKQGYNFTTGLENVQNKLKEYDFVLANLSTPIAGKTLGYSTTKTYNAPDELINTLKDLNISAVATATYHIYDKEEEGISSTIKKLEDAGIKQTGISNEKRSEPIILTKDNINIGILSYTLKSNIKLNSESEYLNVFSEENVISDVSYLKNKNVDVILAYLSTYGEDTTMTSLEHKQNTDILFDNGVNIVLGGGVAAVQENYEDEIELKDSTKSHIYTIYSLGDFMGGYTSEYAKASIIPSFEITKSVTKNRKDEVKQVLVDFKINSPILTWTSVDKNYNKTIYLMEEEISNFNNDKSNLKAKEFNMMKEEYSRILKMYE